VLFNERPTAGLLLLNCAAQLPSCEAPAANMYLKKNLGPSLGYAVALMA
jgi:hypothetical protein